MPSGAIRCSSRTPTATCRLTLASHAAILTGRLPFDNGVRDNYGYSLAPECSDTRLVSQGARLCDGGGRLGGGARAGLGPRAGIRLLRRRRASGRAEERDGSRTEAALEAWLEGQPRRSPFFAFLHLFEPHTPYEPPEPYRSRYPSPYDGEIARADEIVGGPGSRSSRPGRLRPGPDRFPLRPRRGSRRSRRARARSLPLSGGDSRSALVKLPGARRAGESVARPVGLVDVFPTIARVADLAPPKGLSGAS